MKGKGGMNDRETGGRRPEAVVLAGGKARKSLRGIAVEPYGRRSLDFRIVVGRPAPRNGRGRGAEKAGWIGR